MANALFNELPFTRTTDDTQHSAGGHPHPEREERTEEPKHGLFALLDRLLSAAVGAVEGAVHGWSSPAWAQEADAEDAPAPAPALVDAVMTHTVQVIGPDASLHHAASQLWEHDCGVLPVLNASSGRVLGMITDRDLLIAAWSRGARLGELRVRDVMGRELLFCRSSDSISEAHRQMRRGQVRRLPVLDENEALVGVISIADLVHHALPRTAREAAAAVLKTLGAIAPIGAPPS